MVSLQPVFHSILSLLIFLVCPSRMRFNFFSLSLSLFILLCIASFETYLDQHFVLWNDNQYVTWWRIMPTLARVTILFLSDAYAHSMIQTFRLISAFRERSSSSFQNCSRIHAFRRWSLAPLVALPTGSPQAGPQHSRMPQQALRAFVPMNISPKNSRTSCKIYSS